MDGGGRGSISPQHLQRVGLMDLDAALGTIVALFEMLHDAALTNCREKINTLLDTKEHLEVAAAVFTHRCAGTR